MLVLTRHRDQSVIIGENTEVRVVDVRGDKVRLGFIAPEDVAVHRKEVYEAIRRENRAAAEVRPEDLAGLHREHGQETVSPMTGADLARKIDHTILMPEALSHEVQNICAEAREHHFASVCVAAAWVPQVVGALRGSGVLTCTVAAFPHGTSKGTTKSIESIGAIKDGADEVDIVIHLPHLLTLNLDAARAELMEVVRASRAARRDVVIKVIVESAALLSILGDDRGEQAIEIACRAVRESGSDFIKTSTGFHPAGGASVKAVSLMKKYGQSIQIKASGGIRDLATARAMLDAGADRLGMSASVAVLKELQAS